jgi:fibronectin-binding autotransporter adhesin
MTRFAYLICTVFVAILFVAASSAIAQPLTWDPAGDGSTSGGSGNWNTGSWYNGTADTAWADYSDAVFQGTGGTVTLATPVTVNNLTFDGPGYSIAGSTLTFNMATVNPDPNYNPSPIITTNYDTTISATIGTTGGGPLNFAGSASLNLTGASNLGDARFYLGSGSLTISGTGAVSSNQWANIGSESNNTVGLTLRDSARFMANGDFNLGDTPGFITGNTVTVNVQDNAYLRSGGNIFVGKGATNTGTLNISGGSVNSGDIRVDQGTGTVNQSGGVANIKYWFRMGVNAGSSGTYNLTGGTLNAGVNADGTTNGGMQINIGEAGNGALNISNGLLTSTGLFDIGDTGTGTVVQTGGTIHGGGEIWVGQNGTGTGTYTISAGLLTSQSWIAVGRAGGTGIVNMTGGTISKQGGGNVIVGSLGGNGTWNMNGGSVLNNAGLALGENSNSGTFYLNAGLVQASFVQTWGAATGNLYFNGGTLQIGGNGGYVGARDPGTGGVLNTYIQAGGAIIDTNGYGIVVNNPLMTDPALTSDGGLTKNGLGTLALNGTGSTATNAGPSSYVGPTVVDAGTLLITGSLTSTSGIQVKSGATMGGDGPVAAVVLDAGATLAPGYTYGNPLQVGVLQPASLSSTGGTLAFKLSNNATAGNDFIQVAGNLSLSNVTIDIATLLNSALSSGTYGLITSGSTTNLSGLTLAGLPVSRQKYSLDLSTPNTVNLDVSAATPANLIWRGGNEGDKWNLTAKNWYNTDTAATDQFFNLDNVTFDDSGSTAGVVTIPANVQPQSVTFSNLAPTTAYTLTGSGGITGTTPLVMSGAGSLTISNSNSYTGPTTVNGGQLILTGNGSLNGTSAINIAALTGTTGTLSMAGNSSITTRYLAVGEADGDLTSTGAGIMIVSGNSVVNDSGDFNVGFRANATGVLNMSGGSVNATNFFVGHWDSSTGTATLGGNASVVSVHEADVGSRGSAIGNLILKDSASFTQNNDWFFVGTLNTTQGILSMSNSSHLDIQSGDINIGFANGAIGQMTMSDHASTHARYWVWIARYDNSSGTLTMSGDASLTAERAIVGGGGSGGGTMTMTGNSSVAVTQEFWVGETQGGQPGATANTLTIQDNATISTGTWFAVGRENAAPGTMNMNGGTVSVNTVGGGNLIIGSLSGNGTWYMNAGKVLSNNGSGLALGENSNTGTMYLNGGLVQANWVQTWGAATGNLYFNGGTLQISGNGGYIGARDPGAGGVLNTYIQAGGAIIDTNGYNIPVNTALVEDFGSTGGGLTKIGAGTLTLTNANTYAGGTTVKGGILQINADAALGVVPASPAVNLTLDGGQIYNNGGQLDIDINRNIVLGAGGGYIQPGWGPAGITVNGQISGTGSLGVAWDGGVLVLTGSDSYKGNTTIGTTGNGYWVDNAANVALRLGNAHALPPTTSVSFGTSANNNTATLDLNGYNLEIAGLSGSTNALVDNVSGGGKITLTVGNQDASSTFAGSIKNTTGTVALDKIGTGTLVLSGTNGYAGGTVVTGGVLDVTSAAALLDGTSLSVGTGLSAFPGGAVSTPLAGSAGVSAVPEPGTFVLMAAGALCGLAWSIRRRQRSEDRGNR